MLPYVSGKPIELKSLEPSFPEFPHLLFGESIDNGIRYFDATTYLQQTNSTIKVEHFFSLYSGAVQTIKENANIADSDVCGRGQNGHVFIHSDFTHIFIMCTDPNYLVYVCERLDDLLESGFALSDRRIVFEAISRNFDPSIFQEEKGGENG